MERLCDHCKQSFVPKRADANYCGHSCRQRAYLARKAGQAIEQLGELTHIKSTQVELTDKKKKTDSAETSIAVTREDFQPAIVAEPMNDYYSSFLDYIGMRISLRHRDSFLSAFEIRYPELSFWVNGRCLCLIESLLAVSEMKEIDLDELKDICNAFHLFLNSETFKDLPVNYPYTNEMTKYYESIRQFCINSEEENVVLRFTRTTKAELLAARFELAQVVPWVRFDQLNFEK